MVTQFSEDESEDIKVSEKKKKKTRGSYTCQYKANIIKQAWFYKSGVHKFNSFNQCLQYVVSNKKQSNKEIVVISRRFFKESLNTLQARWLHI